VSGCRIEIWPDRPTATVSPLIYGHNAELVGRGVYEGIWVGPRSKIPNEGGLRLDVLAALKQLRAPILRWPGSCTIDGYHWRDGIGNPKDRPQTVSVWARQVEPNTFGTDEFIRLCAAVGCEPYLGMNAGTGTIQEALDWLEYCNFGGESGLSHLRQSHGGAKPYGVRYWSVGGGCWQYAGRPSAAEYARHFVKMASFMRGLDPNVQIVASGWDGEGGGESWNHDFASAMPHEDLIDHLSIHRYFSRGHGVEFDDDDYHGLFDDLRALEHDIQQTEHVLRYFYPNKRVGIAVDEWGLRHPCAVPENGLEQANSLRDAVFAGAALNLFNRYAHCISMTNIVQAMNSLQCLAVTGGARMHLTPTYHVYDMMRPHMGARLLLHEMESEALSVSATLQDHRILLTVANQTLDQDVETRVELAGVKQGHIIGRILNAASARDGNSFESPKTVSPKRFRFDFTGSEFAHTFPAHSFTALTITPE